jgi:hypothetical protein
MNKNNFFYGLLSGCFLLFNCHSQKPEAFYQGQKMSFIPFCELPQHKNQVVFTQMNYWEIVEYAGLSSPDKSCKLKHSAQLNFKLSEVMSEHDQKLLAQMKGYELLKISAIGIYDNGNPKGYGHEGANEGLFTVLKIIEIKKNGRWR